MASVAAKQEVPKEVTLKEVKDFKIIGNSKKNVEGKNIVMGKPLFTMDYKPEGMLIAMMAHPPAFGLKVKSVNDSEARTMPGIKDVFIIKTFADDYERSGFDTAAFITSHVVFPTTTTNSVNAAVSKPLRS